MNVDVRRDGTEIQLALDHPAQRRDRGTGVRGDGSNGRGTERVDVHRQRADQVGALGKVPVHGAAAHLGRGRNIG